MSNENREFDFQKLLESTKQNQVVREDVDSSDEEVRHQLHELVEGMTDEQLYQFYSRVLLPELDRERVLEELWDGWGESHYNDPSAWKNALKIAQGIKGATKTVTGVTPKDTRSPERKAQDDERLGKKSSGSTRSGGLNTGPTGEYSPEKEEQF